MVARYRQCKEQRPGVKKTIVCHNAQQAFKAITEILWPEIKSWLLCGGGKLVVSVKPETRSSAQNNRLWAMLGEIAAQVNWHGRKLSDTEWKHVFSASYSTAQTGLCPRSIPPRIPPPTPAAHRALACKPFASCS